MRSPTRAGGNSWPRKFSISTGNTGDDSETEAVHCVSPEIIYKFIEIRIT